MDKETPITKYLATLEKRQALLFGGSTAVSPPGQNIRMKLSFDDTYMMGQSQLDQSLLHLSPPKSSKRKRFSYYDNEDDEELQRKSSELERLLRQTQADLIDSRAQVTKLEHQIGEIKRQYKERIIAIEKSTAKAKSDSKNAHDHADRLEQQFKLISQREADLSEKLKCQSEAHAVKFRVMEECISKLRCENAELSEKLNNNNIKSDEEVRKLSNDLQQTERGAEKWIMDTQLLKEQLDLKDVQLKKYQREQLAIKIKEVQALSLSKSENKPMESASQLGLLEERVKKYENLYCQQQNEKVTLVKAMKNVQEDNQILRSTMRSEMVLKEQITSLESQLNSSNNNLKRQAVIESENFILKEELNRWKSVANKIDSTCTNAHEFESFVRQIQNLQLELKHENSNLQYQYESNGRMVTKLQAETMSLRDQVKICKEENHKLALDMKNLTRRMGLIAKDRDGLKGLKDSYEQEFTGLISSPLQGRIAQLESVVAEYEAILKEDASLKKNCNECENRMSLVNQLRVELESKKRELSEVHATYMEQKPNETLSSDDITEGIKVVAFGMNPSSLSLEERIKQLISENERLKGRLNDFVDQSTTGIVDGSLREEKNKLEEQLKVLQRKHEILTEAYDYETQMLNSAITRLFGFHITLIQEPTRQIRLQSIYSSSNNPEDAFIFQEADNQDMMLLETPILNNFRDDIDRFLIGSNSIPAFIACVTITYVQSSSSQSSYDDMSLIPLSQDSQGPSQPRIVDVQVQDSNEYSVDEDDDAEEEEDDVEEEEEPMYEEDDENDDPQEDYDNEEDDDDCVTIDDDD